LIMSVTVSAARKSEAAAKRPLGGVLPTQPGVGRVVSGSGADSGGSAESSVVDLGGPVRVTLMLAPQGRGSLREQAVEVLTKLRDILARQPVPMAVTIQTIFLRDPRDQRECEAILAGYNGDEPPITNFVQQPPCCGAALALEAWAIGGSAVTLKHFGPHGLSVSYDGVRWIYEAGLTRDCSEEGVYGSTLKALEGARSVLVEAGSGFDHVVRTWFCLGGITEPEAETQRYKELNRARADFYHDIRFGGGLPRPDLARNAYPASTGIGMSGQGLVLSCLALETRRKDVCLVPLENPGQTPAYAYHLKHSPQSPKFSRAMALILGDYVTIWISGTASILDSESRHPGDVEKQANQTIDNIERLISRENFAWHGVGNAGATLRDLAKIRVYLKHPEDFARCKAVCEQRFGPVPAIYAHADVCRPELLVEIEGIAFSRLLPSDGRPADWCPAGKDSKPVRAL
jgi:enamine deaminase RidA (YjgF/YER057c/UK114 family)